MNRRNLLLGTAGLALGIAGCSNRSGGPSKVEANKVPLINCPALKAYIDSLCSIPEGTFRMGSADGSQDESPVHDVGLSAFRMGQTPVTVAMWEEYVGNSNASMPPEPNPKAADARKFNIGWSDKNHPIVNVNWDECQHFVTWASEVTSEVTGVKLSLPSEAQWEYACRGGREGLKYPWGNEFDRSKIWCSNKKLCDRGSTGSVDRRVYVWRNHPWGLIDIAGNVWEWCEDWYDPNWYQIPEAKDVNVVNRDSSPNVKLEHADGSTTGNQPARCVRGGSWGNHSREAFRCAYRGQTNVETKSNGIGFRLVTTA